MRILGLCSYPVESAATRYRLEQFVAPLAKKGIKLEISPFLDRENFALLYQKNSLPRKVAAIIKPFFQRLTEIIRLRQFDLILVQREAVFFGPAFFEFLFQKIGKLPLVLDLDDATYVSYVSPTYGKHASFLKFFGKTDKLIQQADVVICGNRFIAEYVKSKGTKTVIIPTIANTDKFFPVEKNNPLPVLGWIGTHSTFPLLQSIFPVLQKLAEKHDFILRIVGAGVEKINLAGVKVENLKWSLEREISDFQSLDIGLYPVTVSGAASSEWILGKSGFKAIQYLAVGVPFVMTPIGVCAEIGAANISHFNAESPEDWYNSLDKLLSDKKLREEMGKAGRKIAIQDFTVEQQCEKLENVLTEVFSNFKNKY